MALQRQLTDEEKAALRADLIERLRLLSILSATSLGALAAKYGVSKPTIWRLERKEYDAIASQTLSLSQIAEIREARKLNHVTQEALEGFQVRVISERHDISVQTLYRYLWRLQDEVGEGKSLAELWEAA